MKLNKRVLLKELLSSTSSVFVVKSVAKKIEQSHVEVLCSAIRHQNSQQSTGRYRTIYKFLGACVYYSKFVPSMRIWRVEEMINKVKFGISR